jgi:hypothetical protein
MSEDRRKRPSFPWYPGDWKRDTAVQSCAPLVRYLWREMLDIMHDGEPYGHLTAGGRKVEPGELARMVGLQPRFVSGALAELGEKNVYSVTPDGVIFCRRMVRDEVTRNARADGGADSAKNPNVPRCKDGSKDTPEDTSKDGGDSAKANSNTSFDLFWEGYPRRVGKAAARKAWDKLKVDCVLLESILAALAVQRATHDWRKDGGKYVPHPATWLNGRRWEDELPGMRLETAPPSQDADWWAECQELHGGQCNGSLGHRQRMQMDAIKGAA